MSRSRASAARASRSRERPSSNAWPDGGARIALGAIVVMLIGTALAVDPSAEAAFDAPKRLIAMVGAAVAAVALGWNRVPSEVPPRWRTIASEPAAVIAALGGLALVSAVFAAVAAPHRARALDTLRVAAVLALLLPVGASRALTRRGAGVALASFLAAAAVNAALAMLQAVHLANPFDVESIAGRIDAGAMIGNEGLLAQLLVLATVAALGVTLVGGRSGVRRLAASSLPLYLTGLAATGNFTAVFTLAAGVTAVLILVFGRRAVLPLVAAGSLLVAGVFVAPPLRGRVQAMVIDARGGAWDAVVTYRLGPWAAGLEMVREHPFVGMGPGTFGTEFVVHRLAAEMRFRRRLTIPLVTSTFDEAHCDYLQLAAEIGLPAAVAVVGAVLLLLRGLGRRAWASADVEGVVLCATLLTVAVSALTWFPMQRPVSAVPILLAAGRGWRVLRAQS